MKKLISLSLLILGFLWGTSSVFAQNEEHEKLWEEAAKQTEKLSENVNLSDNDKAYITRHLYNYQDRLNALAENRQHLSFESKSEIEERLDLEMKTVLGEEKFNDLKALMKEIIEEETE